MKHLYHSAFLILILLLSACLDGREEYWINRDSSGRLEASYTLPSIAISQMGGDAALRTKIENFFANQTSVSMTHLNVSRKGGSVMLEIKIAFQRAADFIALLDGGINVDQTQQPDAIDQLLGAMTAKRDGIAVAVQRNVDIRQLFAGGMISPSSPQIRDRHLEYIIHLPVVPHHSNAHEVTDQGKTLLWKYPLAYALKEPIYLEVNAPIPIPYWLIALLFILITALIAAFFWKKARKSRQRPC